MFSTDSRDRVGREPGSQFSLFPDLTAPVHNEGILPCQAIRRLVDSDHIESVLPLDEDQLQPASLDLRLGAVAYQVRASLLPGEKTRVEDKLRELKSDELDLTIGSVLQRECVYIIPLMETLRLPRGISGRANPKSTLGRLDVFTRLITDYAREFDEVVGGYTGQLYVEVAPRSFSVLVRAGTKLNQLRLRRGDPPLSDTRLKGLNETEALVYLNGQVPVTPDIEDGLWISIDLEAHGGHQAVGYRARKGAPVVDLDRIRHYDPEQFWETISPPADRQLILQPREFYILGSLERIRVPATHAAEMVSYDPSVGEYRIHYAGFFDPGFGYGRESQMGTRAVLEVRSHEVPVLLEHGQRVGRLKYEQLLEIPDRLYGMDLGSSYSDQEIALSKQFRMAQATTASSRPA